MDRFKQRGAKLDPIEDLMAFGPVGQRRVEADEVADQPASSEQVEHAALPPWARQFQLVPIDQIRPGPFQVRMVKDEEKDEQLRKQIREDLSKYQTVQHVFIVVPDQEDGRFYNPQMGGHRRLEISREEGAKQVFIWVKEYNLEELARGTYAENDPGTRQELTIPEQGEQFRRVQHLLGWTQTEIAERFHVVGGQPHVARCIQAASYPEDIRKMLYKDPDRGMRAAHILAQLDEALGPEKALEARAPLIEAFLAKQLNTDALQIAVDHVKRKTLPGISLPGKPITQGEVPAAPLSIEEAQQLEQATRVRKSVERYARDLGESKPSAKVREELLRTRQKIDAILARQ